MARAMMALLMLALLLCVLVSSFEDVFALEDAWTTSGVGDFFMPFSIKGMIGSISGVQRAPLIIWFIKAPCACVLSAGFCWRALCCPLIFSYRCMPAKWVFEGPLIMGPLNLIIRIKGKEWVSGTAGVKGGLRG